MELAWFVGVDWGSQTHQACVSDVAGKLLGERAFEHGGQGLSEMADWILSFTAGKAEQVGVAIETPRGPVVESLMERGFAVHAINPKQLDRFRDRISPAGAKDDRRDARVLASALRTDPHCLRRLEPTDPAIVELREWSRLSEEITRERVRQANRMREQLWRYYPQLLAATSDDVAASWALALWRRLPTPVAAQRVREATLAKLLKQHRIRRVDAATLCARLRAPAVRVAPGAAEAAAAHVRLIAERLVLVNRQLAHARSQLDRLVHQLAEAAPAEDPDAPAESEPEPSPPPPDAAILLALPGIGTGVLACLLAEGSDALRRRDYAALRCLCGVAPVTRRSGKSLLVVRRLAAHDRLRNAAYHWARVAAHRDPVSRAKYQALRSRGHGHARSLRSVADRLLNVACAMLRDGTCFDPHRGGGRVFASTAPAASMRHPVTSRPSRPPSRRRKKTLAKWWGVLFILPLPIMVFLHSHGVGTARAVRIFRTYGADAIEVMTENPYRLARDIRGIGFKTADAIAMKLGIAKTAMVRVRAGIGYALTEAMDEGHCGLPADELGPLAARLLDVPDDVIRTALDLELAEGTVVADTVVDTPCVFLGALYRAERAIAERLLDIAAGKLPWPRIDVERALPWVERKTGRSLAPGQAEAVRLALTSKAVVITGGPGVGKTTIVDAILRILAAKGVELVLCAPTGRAARRMSEATGSEARTIHRLLEVDPRDGGFRRNADNPLDCGLLVVDEASMVDVMLMRALLAAVPDAAAVLIVGDVDQLPSVGPGQVLADSIASGTVPVVRLTEVFRQAARSRIVTSAHGINRGAIPDLSRPDGDSDFYFVSAEDPETAAVRIVDLVKSRIPRRFGFDAVRDIQVLCPMNRGGAGARSLNIELQAALNPAGERKVERFGWTFAPGDKVMQIENDYDKEVYNGDIGQVADVDPEAGELTARFDGRKHVYGFGELDALVLAYAATVHKSQGSEYPAVVIPVLTQHYVMLRRNLLYTGVTRGKRLVVLVGQKKAVAIAVRNVSGRRRWSKLDEWLRGPEGEFVVDSDAGAAADN